MTNGTKEFIMTKKFAVVDKSGYIYESTETYEQAIEFKNSLPEETDAYIQQVLTENINE
jgi:hypothetical protein